jgi:formate C-acetyltransferase
VGLERLVQLFQTYLGEGGSHLMLNVVGAETLRDAMAHPERHRDLMVRVSGLSAHFVVLPRHIQEDLVARAESGL